MSNSTVHDVEYRGIYASGAGSAVSSNTVYNITAGYGIYAGGTGTSVSGNTVYACSTGIYASGALTVSSNTADDNSSYGIYAAGNVQVTGNTVYGQSRARHRGDLSVQRQHHTRQPERGLPQHQWNCGNRGMGRVISGNRVYGNSGVGITSEGDVLSGNDVYSNNVGSTPVIPATGT